MIVLHELLLFRPRCKEECDGLPCFLAVLRRCHAVRHAHPTPQLKHARRIVRAAPGHMPGAAVLLTLALIQLQSGKTKECRDGPCQPCSIPADGTRAWLAVECFAGCPPHAVCVRSGVRRAANGRAPHAAPRRRREQRTLPNTGRSRQPKALVATGMPSGQRRRPPALSARTEPQSWTGLRPGRTATRKRIGKRFVPWKLGSLAGNGGSASSGSSACSS